MDIIIDSEFKTGFSSYHGIVDVSLRLFSKEDNKYIKITKLFKCNDPHSCFPHKELYNQMLSENEHVFDVHEDSSSLKGEVIVIPTNVLINSYLEHMFKNKSIMLTNFSDSQNELSLWN